MKHIVVFLSLITAGSASAEVVAPKALERVSSVDIVSSRGEAEPCSFDQVKIHEFARQRLIEKGFEVVVIPNSDAFLSIDVNALRFGPVCMQNIIISLLQDKGLDEGFFVLAQQSTLIGGTQSYIQQTMESIVRTFVEQLRP